MHNTDVNEDLPSGQEDTTGLNTSIEANITNDNNDQTEARKRIQEFMRQFIVNCNTPTSETDKAPGTFRTAMFN